MTGSPLDPIAVAGQRLRWLDQRQRVLAQNIANADTPGYAPKDLAPFAAHLERAATGLAGNDPRHLPVGTAERPRADRAAVESSATGNAVSLDREALKVAETDQAQALALGLHRSWMNLFRTALGRG